MNDDTACLNVANPCGRRSRGQRVSRRIGFQAFEDDDAELFLEERLHIILGVPLLNTVVSSISRNTAAQQLWNTILATFLAGDRCNNMITSGVR